MLERARRGTDLRFGRLGLASILAGGALVTAACGSDQALGPTDGSPAAFEWQLPPGFPPPRVPADDPMTAEKVALGRHLFYDVRLSGDQTQSCASCHQQALAFTDGEQTSIGSTGDVLPRGAMSLANVGYAPARGGGLSALTWANNSLVGLTEQMLTPMFNDDPVELGGVEDELLSRLRADSTYQSLFPDAFPDEPDPFTVDDVTKAIASFERTLISGNSRADRFREGDKSALSLPAQAGHDLFFSKEEVGCSNCHKGDDGEFFTSNFDFEGRDIPHIQFDNNALYNLSASGGSPAACPDGDGLYPEPNTGLYALTGRPEDMGRFKVPTLRNIALTAPYMHDGSIATLDEVLDHYVAGGRTIDNDPNAGVGSANCHKSILMKDSIPLTSDQRRDLIAFLNALTDEAFVTDARFSNPWPDGSPARGQ